MNENSKAADCPGDKTILLVEDEASIREIESQMLDSAGYKVLSAGDAAKAHQLFKDHGDRIDLLLADMVLPGGSGMELYLRFKKINPGLRAIIVSGGLKESYGFDEEVTFLQKPYRMATLIEKVKSAF